MGVEGFPWVGTNMHTLGAALDAAPPQSIRKISPRLGQATCPPAMSTLPLGIYRHGVVEIRGSQGSTAAVGDRSTGNKDLPVCQDGHTASPPPPKRAPAGSQASGVVHSMN